jgi:hypothetical protein
MADSAELKKAIEDSQRLLQYASVKGIELPADLLTQIVAAQGLAGKQSDDPSTFGDQEVFWSALSKLSALTKPASTDSVRHAAATMPDMWATLWAKLTGRSAASPVLTSTSVLAVRKARFWALVGLALVAVFQAYYEVGQTTVTTYAKASGVLRVEAERVSVLSRALTGVGQAKASEAEVKRMNDEMAGARLKIEEATDETDRRLYWMKKMLFWHEGPALDPNDPRAPAMHAQSMLGVLEGWLTLLRNFVLPIAWSFLGAALYVSRALAEDIRGMAYAPERAILHRSRYYMGMVAGFVAAKFFPASTGIDMGEVTPFAVALLVGYSVEVLFALLDKLISAFSTK